MNRYRVVSRSGNAVVNLQRRVDTIKVMENVWLYQSKIETASVVYEGKCFPHVPPSQPIIEEGVIGGGGHYSTTNLKLLLTGRPHQSNVVAIDDDGITEITLNGEQSPRFCNGTLFCQTPFQDFKDGRLKSHNFLEFWPERFMFFEAGRGVAFEGNPLPIVMVFDHRNAQFDDERFDLEKLVDHILTLQEGWITDPTHMRRIFDRHEAIFPLRMVDRTTKRQRYISVAWLPRKEIYREMWQQAKRDGHKDIHRTALEWDIFKLNKSGLGSG